MKKIYKVTQEQLTKLQNGDTITVGGISYTYETGADVAYIVVDPTHPEYTLRNGSNDNLELLKDATVISDLTVNFAARAGYATNAHTLKSATETNSFDIDSGGSIRGNVTMHNDLSVERSASFGGDHRTTPVTIQYDNNQAYAIQVTDTSTGSTTQIKVPGDGTQNDVTITFPSGDGKLALTSDIPTIDSALSSTSTNPVQNKVINTALGTKQNTISSSNKLAASLVSGLSTVATSGSYNDLSNKPTIPTVNNGTLTIQTEGTSKGTFTANQSGNTTINIKASDLGLSAAMKFLGTTTTAISDGSTTNPITISGSSVTATAGNVVLYSSKEFVWTGSLWEELGDEGSHALKSITITGTGALSGGGSLEANRTITHNAGSAASKSSGLYKFSTDAYSHVSSVTSVTKADITALGIPGSDTNTTYTLVSDTANQQIKLTASDGSSQSIFVPYAVKANTANYLNVNATAVGSSQVPVYINSDGKPVACGWTVQSNSALSSTTPSMTSTASRTYAVVQCQDGKLGVNVPWTDTNTTYSVVQTTGSPGLMTPADKSKLDNLTTNIENGSGSTAIQMKQDGTTGTFSFTGKNPNATALDSSLTGDITYGGTGAFATTLGGKGTAIGKRSVSQGTTTIAKGAYSHAEGDNSVALGSDSHAEGYATTSQGQASHSEGNSTQAIGNNSHAEGNATISNAFGSHSEGRASTTLSSVPSSGGGGSSDEPPASEPDKYLGYYSHAEGENTITLGYASHSEGAQTKAYGHWSHAEGLNSTTGVVNDRTKGKAAHASGINTKAIGNYSSATGDASSSTGESSIATGKGTESTGLASISGGQSTHATSDLSVALGYSSTASGWSSFAFGSGAKAIGSMSVAFGEATEMTASSGMAIGKFNVPNSSALFQVGNGTSATHSNAFEVLNDGTAKVGAMGSETLSVATKGYVDGKVGKNVPSNTGFFTMDLSNGTLTITKIS